MNCLIARSLLVGACNSYTPCENEAYYSSNSICNYSPTECATGCSSSCDAKTECGQYDTPGKQRCPRNVWCSQFGSVSSLGFRFSLADSIACSFCGSADDSCNTGCQQGFAGPRQPITKERQFCSYVSGMTTKSVTPDSSNRDRICNGQKWLRACQYYSSVIEEHQTFVDAHERGYNPLTCPTFSRANFRGGGRCK